MPYSLDYPQYPRPAHAARQASEAEKDTHEVDNDDGRVLNTGGVMYDRPALHNASSQQGLRMMKTSHSTPSCQVAKSRQHSRFTIVADFCNHK